MLHKTVRGIKKGPTKLLDKREREWDCGVLDKNSLQNISPKQFCV
jgi:hypothetical protein